MEGVEVYWVRKGTLSMYTSPYNLQRTCVGEMLDLFYASTIKFSCHMPLLVPRTPTAREREMYTTSHCCKCSAWHSGSVLARTHCINPKCKHELCIACRVQITLAGQRREMSFADYVRWLGEQSE